MYADTGILSNLLPFYSGNHLGFCVLQVAVRVQGQIHGGGGGGGCSSGSGPPPFGGTPKLQKGEKKRRLRARECATF